MAEKRLIDVNALLEKLRTEGEEIAITSQYNMGYLNGLKRAQSITLAAPTVDAVEVVRCEECLHRVRSFCNHPDGLLSITENSFCPYGERRTDAR